MADSTEDEAITSLANALKDSLVTSSSLKIPVYSGSLDDDVSEFKETFDYAADAANWKPEQKVKKLPCYLRGAARSWFTINSKLDDGSYKDYDEVMRELEEYFLPQNNRAHLLQLAQRPQEPNESVQAYVLRKQRICAKLDTDMPVSDIISYIEQGFRSDIQMAMSANVSTTLSSLVTSARRAERMIAQNRRQNPTNHGGYSQQSNAFQGNRNANRRFNNNMSPSNYRRDDRGDRRDVNDRRNYNDRDQPRNFSNSHSNERRELNNRTVQHQNFSRTTRGGPRCFVCGVVGHIARFCSLNGLEQTDQNRQTSNRPEVNNSARRQSRNTCNQLKTNSNNGLITMVVGINGHRIVAMVDTGSTVTVISEEVAKKTGCTIQPYSGPDVETLNGETVEASGQTTTIISLQLKSGACHEIEIDAMVVTNSPYELLLGNDFNSKANLNVDCSSGLVSMNLDENKVLIHLSEDVIIPPRLIICAAVNLSKHTAKEQICYIATVPQTNLEICQEKCEITDGSGVLALRNKGANPIKLAGGTILGTVRPNKNIILALRNDQHTRTNRNGKIADVIFLFHGFITTYFSIWKNWIISKPTNVCLTLKRKISDRDHWQERMEKSQAKVISTQKSAVCNALRKDVDLETLDVNKDLNSDQKSKMKRLIQRYKDLFAFKSNKLGCNNVYQLEILTGDEPTVHQPPYRVSIPERQIIKDKVKEMLEMGVIRYSNSPWASPVVLVKKKEGGFRFCVDYRKLNAITIRDHYPLPPVQDCVDALSGSRFFTKLDANSGFWQIPIKEEHKMKTAFITPDGLFEFNFMPFGVTNGPAVFQRAMDQTISGLKWNSAENFIDDVCVHTSDFDSHLKILEDVFMRLRSKNFTLSPTKCNFGYTSVSYLGFEVSEQGIRPDPAKVDAVMEFPIPTCVRDVRSFIGLSQYYRRFIKDFSKIAEPLSRLTKNDQKFEWSSEQDAAFEKLKICLVYEPVLTHFRPDLPTEVRTDACGIGVGAILLQKHEEGFKVIAYESRLLQGAELNYSISEKETLAIVFALRKFRPYIALIKFSIVTDHCSLCFLMKKSNLTPRLTRWAMQIQEYDFTIVYKSGKHHHDVDALSRYPVHNEGMEPERDIMFINVLQIKFDIRKEQQDDLYLQAIIDKLENFDNLTPKQKRMISKYTLVDGILYKVSQTPTELKLLTVVPSHLRVEILYSYHDDPCAGHLGIRRTLDRIRERFYFKKMANYVYRYVRSCDDCQTKKRLTTATAGLMKPIEIGGPFERIGIDILGPFPRTERGNRYIVVAIDYLTRYAITGALQDATALAVAEFFLDEIVTKHGAPRELLSDRGVQFMANLSKEVFRMMNTKHVTTTAYHPQTNGLVERLNGTLATMLSMYVSSDHKDWDRCLNFVTFAYNSAVQESTKFTPFFLVHGREPTTPTEVLFDIPSMGVSDPNAYATILYQRVRAARKAAKNFLEKSQVTSKNRYDLKRVDKLFEIGDLVLVFYPTRIVGRSEKLLHQFQGPYKILRRFSPLVYEVETIRGRKRKEKVHISRLKKYHQRVDSPNELEREQIELSPPEIVEDDLPSSELVEIDSDPEIQSELICEFTGNQEQNNEEIPTNDIVEETNQTPERPAPTSPKYYRTQRGRVSKPTVRFSPMFILYFMLISNTECGLNRAAPIIWTKSDRPVISGSTEIFIQLKYENPCQIFTPDILPKGSYDTIQEWCKTVSETDFVEPLSTFCPSIKESPLFKISLNRQKRVIPLLIIGALVFVSVASVATTIGLSTTALVKTSNLENRVDSIQSAMNKMSKQLEQMTKNDEYLKEAIEKLKNTSIIMMDRINQNTEVLNNLTNALPGTILLVSHLTARLLQTKSELHLVARDWKHGKINEALFRILNFTAPCQTSCPIELMTPVSCQLDNERRLVHLHVRAPNIDPNKHIANADAFSYFTRNGSKLCEVAYRGPKAVILDRENSCVTPLEGISDTSTNNLILKSIDSPCGTFNGSAIRYWSKIGCTTVETLSESDVLQVKNVGENNLIYCFPFKIVVYGFEQFCPYYVFQLPSSVTFKVGSLLYDASEKRIASEINLDPDWVHQINFNLMPNLHLLDPSKELESLDETLKKIVPHDETTHIEFIKKWSEISLTLWSFGALLAAGLIGYLCCLRRYRSIRNQAFEMVPRSDTEVERVEVPGASEISALRDTGSKPTNPKPRKVSFLTTITLIMILTATSAESCSFNYYIVNLKIVDPCLDIGDAQAWCTPNFKKSFIDPLSKYCTSSPDILHIDITRDVMSINDVTHAISRRTPNTTDKSSFDHVFAAAKFAILERVIGNMGRLWLLAEPNAQLIQNIGLSSTILKDCPAIQLLPKSCSFNQEKTEVYLLFKSISKFNSWFIRTPHSILLILLSFFLTLAVAILLAYMTCKFRDRSYVIYTKVKRGRKMPPSRSRIEPLIDIIDQPTYLAPTPIDTNL